MTSRRLLTSVVPSLTDAELIIQLTLGEVAPPQLYVDTGNTSQETINTQLNSRVSVLALCVFVMLLTWLRPLACSLGAVPCDILVCYTRSEFHDSLCMQPAS